MPKSKEITLQLLALYNTYADRLNISANISSVLHKLRDIKASGNEIEITLRNVLSELLPQKYGVSNGHIIDSELNVSKQYDLLITQNIDYKSIAQVKDSTELFFYEAIYGIGECKATWNPTNVKSTINSISDLRDRLYREPVKNDTILSGDIMLQVGQAITNYPFRNPLFVFVVAMKTDDKIVKLKEDYLTGVALQNLPGLTIILNEGIIALVNKEKLAKREISINIYPEFEQESSDYEWKFIKSNDPGKNFSYLIFCLMQHLTSTVLKQPPYLSYAKNVWQTDDEDILNLDEL